MKVHHLQTEQQENTERSCIIDPILEISLSASPTLELSTDHL